MFCRNTPAYLHVKEAGKQKVLKTTKHQKSVTLYWKYFDVKRSQPISVQTSRTGGNQQLTFHDEDDYNYIVTVMTDSFFPDGNNTFGLLKQINIKIGSLRVTLHNSHLSKRLLTPGQIMENKNISDDEEDFKQIFTKEDDVYTTIAQNFRRR